MLHKDKDDDSEELLDDELLLDDNTDFSDNIEISSTSENPDSNMDSDYSVETDTPVADKDNDAEDEYEPIHHAEPSSNDDDDFYNDDEYEEQTPAPKPKQPKLDPEDPDYWLDEQSEFEHILPKPRKVWKWWLAAAIAGLVLVGGVSVWLFRPYVDDSVKYGYIKSMERRGTVVKTFEGVLIPYRELGDKTPFYFEEIPFSVDGDSLAAHMKGMMLNCIPVRVEYELYHRPLFWKGASPMVVVGVDTADVKKILPPEYR